MGALVMVYYLVITGFYFVFYCCILVFAAVGPLWSWLGEGVFKLYSTSSLSSLGSHLGVQLEHLATVEL
jgi:hypothetical protein